MSFITIVFHPVQDIVLHLIAMSYKAGTVPWPFFDSHDIDVFEEYREVIL